MTKKQAKRLAKNRDSQRAAMREHFAAGEFAAKPAAPMRRTARGLRESTRDVRPPREISRHSATIRVNPKGQMRMWLTANVI